MTMNNNNSAFLQHNILNILTLVIFSLTDADLEKKQKEKILEHLKMVGLLVSEQNVFLGKRKKCSKQTIDLNEVLELVLMIHEKEIKKEKVKVSFSRTNLVLVTDNRVLKGGLEQILLSVIETAKKIEISVDEKHRKLSIKYDSAKKLAMDEMEPIKYIIENRSYSEIFFRTAMYLMELNGIKTVFKKGLVEVVFSD